jgi:hypothetical protein
MVSASISASAQKSKFKTGILVTNAGDTLKGFIYVKKNPGSRDSLHYRKTQQSDEVSFAWSSLKYFGTPEEEDFLVCTVKRNLEYIDPYTYNIMLQDSIISEAIPLTPVYKGKHLSLYKYYGPSDYFFISDGAKVVQLVQTYRYLTNNEKLYNPGLLPRYFINYIFRNQLFEFFDFDADRKMFNLLEKTDYLEYPLKSLVSKMDKKLE